LTAIGYNQQEEVAHWQLHTAGKPAALRLTADRPAIQADGQDLCYVTVEVVDAKRPAGPARSKPGALFPSKAKEPWPPSEIPNLTAWKVSSNLNAPRTKGAAWRFSNPNAQPGHQTDCPGRRPRRKLRRNQNSGQLKTSSIHELETIPEILHLLERKNE